jgi:hypothetical protein
MNTLRVTNSTINSLSKKGMALSFLIISLLSTNAFCATVTIGSGFDEINAVVKRAGGFFNNGLKQLCWVGIYPLVAPPLTEYSQFQYYMMKNNLRLYDRGAQQMQGMYVLLDSSPDPIYVFYKSKLVAITHFDSFKTDIAKLPEQVKQMDYYGADYDLAIKYSKDFGILLNKDSISELHNYGVNNVNDLDSAEKDFQKYNATNLYNSLQLPTYLKDKATANIKNQTIAQVVQDRNEEEKNKKAAEQRAENERLSRERLERERLAKEMIRTVQNLSIKSVHLGTGTVPCSPKDELYTDIILHQPVRLQLECSFGSSMDKTTVIFAADGRTIVSVSRRQNLTASDPLPEEIVKKAVAFYGKPSITSSSSSAYYGNLYSSDYGERNENGVGMKIKGSICFAGDVDERECKYLGAVNKVEYELVNMPSLLKSREDGKIRLANRQKSKLHEQSF